MGRIRCFIMGVQVNSPAIDEGDDDTQLKITDEVLKECCKSQNLYSTPTLNDKLYLHFKGYRRIEGLDKWTGLRALWLEGNGFRKLEGLDNLRQLRCLYAHQNCITKIENLETLTLLDTLQLENNFVSTVENLQTLTSLHTLNLAGNNLQTVDDIRHLLTCPSLSVLDMKNCKLQDPDVLDVLEAMPNLAVLHLNGNPVVKKISSYRKVVISRCKRLTYLDDRPVFPDERLAVEAWARGGLEAERQERKRQREEKQEDDRRNLAYMRCLQEEAKARLGVEEEEEEENVDEDQLFEIGLKLLQEKKKQLLYESATCTSLFNSSDKESIVQKMVDNSENIATMQIEKVDDLNALD